MLSMILFVAIGASQPNEAPATEAAEAASETTVAASAEASRQRLICRSRPVLGSRISRQRVCKTEEEWRIYENDLEQSRRDINDRGMRGCTSTSCE